MDLCWQSTVSAFWLVSFSSKKQVCFNFMAAVTMYSDFGAQENKACHSFHCFPIYLHEVMRLDNMILVFWSWVLSYLFHSPLSLTSRGSLVLCFLPEGWCHLHFDISSSNLESSLYFIQSSIPHDAYKLNKQGDTIQPWHTHFPVWIQPVVPYPVLTVASWPPYRFLTR